MMAITTRSSISENPLAVIRVDISVSPEKKKKERRSFLSGSQFRHFTIVGNVVILRRHFGTRGVGSDGTRSTLATNRDAEHETPEE